MEPQGPLPCSQVPSADLSEIHPVHTTLFYEEGW
jgi:hypothetical protein